MYDHILPTNWVIGRDREKRLWLKFSLSYCAPQHFHRYDCLINDSFTQCRDYIKNRRISGDYQMRQGKPIIDQEDTLQENREINTTVNDKKKGRKKMVAEEDRP